jgi:L-seryl-tRNA(Ser) seleniumtransferase
MSSKATNPYRLLPSVEEVLLRPSVAALLAQLRREDLVTFVQEVLDRWRANIGREGLDAAAVSQRLSAGDLEREVELRARMEAGRGITSVVNATGVVLHTGLGRAPIHPEAAAAMAAAAETYCVLEVDRFTGERNQRDERLSELLRRLTGAEAGIVVNNNAGATLLTVNTFASGKSAVVSRGELVEIGGSFRMPDVMAGANSKLIEVGTTNRTRAVDYERACEQHADVGLLLKVHTSNFRLVGFTEEVTTADLAAVGARVGVTTAFDLGSGLLATGRAADLPAVRDEPRVADVVAGGVDVVTFSGDKLLGGPQAGLVVGKAEAVAAMRKNPLYRALRLDKAAIAGLERTLELHLAGRADELPTHRFLLRTADEMKAAADALGAEIAKQDGYTVEVAADGSQPGSGSAPGTFLDTFVVRVTSAKLEAGELGDRLRASDPPIFARVQDGRLILDPRTLQEGEADAIVAALAAAHA